MNKKNVSPRTGKLEQLIIEAKQSREYWIFRTQQLQNLQDHLASLYAPTENDMFTLVYRAYQVLDNIKDVCDVLYDYGIVVETGYQKGDPWRKLTPQDITNIIDFQAIEDDELQDAVRAYYNQKRPTVRDDWNLNGNYERLKAKMEAEGIRALGPVERYIPLIQIDFGS